MSYNPAVFTSRMEADFRSRMKGFIGGQRHKEVTEDNYLYLLRDTGLVGTRWRHYGNKHVYTITGFRWNGDLDEWCIDYMRSGVFGVFGRSLSNSFGDAIDHGTGLPVRRFTLVVE